MSFHPDPVAVTVNGEHHRQELMVQAHRYRLAKDVGGGGFPAVVQSRWSRVRTAVAACARFVAARWRRGLVDPIELPVARDLSG